MPTTTLTSRTLGALGLTLCLLAPSAACIHAPKDYAGSVAQSGQTAIVFWDQGVEDLVLRPAYVSKGGKAPASLAWVIPVPSAPQSYGIVKESAFQALFKAWERNESLATDSLRSAPKGRSNGGIEFLKKAVVGEYEIQPIKATGPAGAKALNAWLVAKGFGAVPEENMAYYVQREWVWLCVKANTRAASGKLRPLRVTFKTPRPVYPLKFSTHQGTFDLTLWVVTRKPLKDLAKVRKTFGVSAPFASLELPEATRKAAKGVKLKGRVIVTRVQRRQLKGEVIAGWEEDLSFEPAK